MNVTLVFPEMLLQAYENDKLFSDEKLMGTQHVTHGNRFYYHEIRLVIPKSMKQIVLKEYHDGPYGRYFGITNTLQHMQDRY